MPLSTRDLAVEADARDSALMARVRERDPAALRELYDRFATMVYGLALRIVRDGPEAEDLTQDVFLHLWRRAELYDATRGPFGGWLVSMARNRAIDRLRSRKTQEKKEDAYQIEVESETVPRAQDPNESAYAAELRGKVKDALGLLTEAQRRALELAFFGGLSHSEVAARLDTPLGTVKARIRQGMLRLRETLAEFADAALLAESEEDGGA